jgi:hypothetical protein
MATGIGVTGMIITPGTGKFNICCEGRNLGKMHKLPFTTQKHYQAHSRRAINCLRRSGVNSRTVH